jgi:hypothetical protein
MRCFWEQTGTLGPIYHWLGQGFLPEHQRNLSVCRDGRETCDYSQLTATEAKMLADAEYKRNYAACLEGRGYCDLSRLTPEESHSIQPRGH